MNYILGHIDPWWSNEHTELSYIENSPIDPICTKQWLAEGYDEQLFDADVCSCRGTLPDWAAPFSQMFDWKDQGYNFMKMRSVSLLPNHSDTFTLYKKVFNLTDSDTICRAVIFMDDWKSGHYFEIEGTPISNWRKGDWVMWENDTVHYAGNIGIEDRYTLQITGHK